MEANLAFLLTSGIAYYCMIVLSEPATKNLSRNKERIAFFVLGTIIIALVLGKKLNLFSAWWTWIALGVFYTYAAVLSYLGHSEWNVLWQKEISPEAQMSMWLWDLLIAVSSFMMLSA